MAKHKSRQIPEEIIDYAVNSGIENLLERIPSSRRSQEVLQNHLNQRELKKVVGGIIEEYETQNLSAEEKQRRVYQTIEEYVASGEILDKAGKKILLKGGLEKKTGNFITRFFSGSRSKGEEYLDRVTEAFKDIYSLLKKNPDIAQRRPELAEAIITINERGFFEPVMDTLKSYGLMTKARYKMFKKAIEEKVLKGYETATKGLEDYAFYQKVAASFIGLVGITMVVGSATMTGGIIGTLGNSGIGIAGIFIFVFALLLFYSVIRLKNQ